MILRVNDRGPFAHSRILDVSAVAARRLGFYRKGYAKVRVRTLVQKSQKIEREIRRVKRLDPIKRLAPIQWWYYISLKTSSCARAQSLSQKLKEYGHVHTTPTLLGARVMMGPYRSCHSAAEMIRHIPTLRKGRIIKKCKTYPATRAKQ